MRLGTKYGITYLRTDALRRLDAQYPSTYSAYKIWSDPKLFITSDSDELGSNLIDTVNLAREMNITRILPMLFLRICILLDKAPDQTSYDLVLRGWPRSDGTRANLSGENSARCIIGLNNLRKYQLSRINWWSRPRSFCGGSCVEKLRQTLLSPLSNGLSTVIYFDSTTRDVEYAINRWGAGMCGQCRTQLISRPSPESPILTWNGLPGAFSLPSWEQLTGPTV